MYKKLEIVHDLLGSYRSIGDEYLFHCPYCNHHKKKMSLNLAMNVFKCWVCDTRGKNIYRLIRQFGTYQQRQKWLQLEGRLDIAEFDKFFSEANEEIQVQTVEPPENFISLCNRHLPRSSQRPFDYLMNRGVTKKDILFWKLGYCDEGRYSGRILGPSFNNDGDWNFFVSRSFCGHRQRYLNPKADRNIIFNELYVDWDEPIVLVEGLFDAIVAGQNSVPVLGSSIRPYSKLFQAIVINDTPVYLAFDEDAKKKTEYIIKNMLKYDIELYLIDTSGCEDVGSMTKHEFLSRKDNAKRIEGDYLFYSKIYGELNA